MTRTQTMQATLKDIAREVGVSEPAVSYALRGVPKVSPAVRDRIVAAADRLGYRPHSAARVMASGLFSTVTLVQDAWLRHSFLTAEMIQGIQEALEKHELLLNLARLSREQMASAATLPRALRELCADGLLVNVNAGPPEAMTSVLEKISIPSIWLNIRRGRDCVHPDDSAAAASLVESLLSSGCRRIGYFDPVAGEPHEHYSRADRFAGYRQAMQSAGLPARALRVTHGRDLVQVLSELATWLAASPDLDGLITYADNDLDLYLHHIRPQERRSRELRLASFFNPHQHRYMPAFRAEHPSAEVGRLAVQCLMKKRLNPSKRMKPVAVPFAIVPPPALSGKAMVD